MKLRTDYARREFVEFTEGGGTPSPESGVLRHMLERDGAEVARATSIVRYAPDSAFPAHVHERGEEFLVLEGTFQDEHGDYPAGTYVRNAPGSRHSPFSRSGCTLFVKLRQFAEGDGGSVITGVRGGTHVPFAGGTLNVLHTFGTEEVALVDLPSGEAARVKSRAPGIEVLVLDGALSIDGREMYRYGWFRSPATVATLRADSSTRAYLKRGHLPVR